MTSERDQSGAGSPPAARRRRWPSRRRARIALVLAAVLLLAFAGAVGRLLSGPVWSTMLAGVVADRIESALDGATVEAGVVGFAVDGRWQPEIHLRDLVVTVPGSVSVSVDTLEVATHWTAPGRSAERVLADHVLVDVAAGAAGPAPALAEVVAAIDRALVEPPLRYLEIGALTLARRDAEGRRSTTLDRVAVTLDGDAAGALSLQVAGTGAAGSWSARAQAVPAGEARRVALRASGLDLADLAAMAGQPDSRVGGPVGLEAALTFADGRITAADGELTIGPLAADEGGPVPVVGSGSRLEFTLRPDGRTLVVLPSPVVLPGGRATVAGEIVAPAQVGDAIAFDLRLALRATGAEDARRGAAEIRGSYDPDAGLLVVDDIHAAGEGTSFAAALRLSHDEDRVAGALSGVFPSMSVDALKSVWPASLVSNARRWVIENVESGMIREATVDLTVADTRIGRDETGTATAAVAFRFEDLAFRAFRNGPMIRAGFGSARLEGGRFVVDMDRGVVDLGEGRSLAVSRGRFEIPDVVAEPPVGRVSLSLGGGADGVVALWNRLPLSGGRGLPANADEVSGGAEAEVSLDLPLVRDLRAADVAYDATVRFAELELAQPVQGRTVSDGSITVRVSGGVAEITGDALLDGVRAEIDLTEPLVGDTASAAAVRLRLDDADRERLGIDLGDLVRGPVSVDATSGPEADGGAVQAVAVDLEEAEVRIGALGFVKPAGDPGTATFTLRRAAGRTEISDLVVEAGEARIAGRVVLDGDGRLVSADLPRVTVRRGDRLAVSARRGEGGVLEVSAKGSRFDARRLVRQLLRGGADGAVNDAVRIEAAIDVLTGNGEESLSGFNLDARLEAGQVAALALTAQTGGGGAASMTLTPAGDARRLEVEAGEVGRLLRFLGVYGRVFGGRAVITGIVDRSGAIRAAVDGSRWRIVDEPALARLSTAADDGPTAGIATAEIERLLFELRFNDGQLRIDDGVVRGATAGLSIQGDVDFTRDTVRLAGTYLPASAFDSLLGKIPLIGQTMFAGGRAGLLGVTFRLSGSIDDPTLTVNPLSAIAPGIFRKLFELR